MKFRLLFKQCLQKSLILLTFIIFTATFSIFFVEFSTNHSNASANEVKTIETLEQLKTLMFQKLLPYQNMIAAIMELSLLLKIRAVLIYAGLMHQFLLLKLQYLEVVQTHIIQRITYLFRLKHQDIQDTFVQQIHWEIHKACMSQRDQIGIHQRVMLLTVLLC